MTTIKNTPVATNKPIQILPPQLANQIAAGEVVERPASVVKELVENSLDATATQIHIEIEQGGQKRILIRDNGKGISKNQLSLALSRHATSKISDIDDLEHITSMGFRGEALASISSVSRLTLTSKPKDQSEAWQAKAEGQQMQVDIQPAAHPDGTSIEVLDLFFNTPARRKFLRTGKTEFQHIEQIIKRIALARPEVQFVLTHNQKVCCRYPAVQSLQKRVEQVCGKNMLKDCASVDYEFDGVHLTGWCSKLGAGAPTRDQQYTFVNGRMMKDKLLSHALRQVYEDTLAPQTFASYVLYLKVAPDQLDVNVHPAKHEVRFHQARQVHDIVYKAVNSAVSDDFLNDSHSSEVDQLSQAPTHGYIQALTPSEPNGSISQHAQQALSENGKSAGDSYRTSNVSYRPSGSSAYSGQARPSGQDIKASHDFYQSIHEASANSHVQVQENDSHAQASAYLYSHPYLIFSGAEACIKTLHIKHILGALIEHKIEKSTCAQPLLMPVSIEQDGSSTFVDSTGDDVTALKPSNALIQNFQASNFVIDSISKNKHNRLILKQVPSELRQLPWARIFPQLNVFSLHAEQNASTFLATLTARIADAWANMHAFPVEQLNLCISQIGQPTLESVLGTHGKMVDLSASINTGNDD